MTKIKRRHLGALSGLLVFLAVFAVACGGEPTPVPTTAAAPQAGGPEAMSMMMEKMGPEGVRAMMGEMMPQVMEKMGPDGVAAMMAEMMPQMMEAMGPENMAMMMEKMQPGGMAKMEGSRLDTVKKRGKLICASRNDVPGYGSLDAFGNNVGFDIDLCRAVASAVLGDPKAIEIRYISASERGPTIQSGEVDMLVRTVTWTTSRDSQWGNYVQTMFFDGQGFMVNKALGISSALELNDAVVCVTQGTTTELNLQDFSNQNNLNISALTFEDTDAVVAAYESGQCDAFTNDRSQLAALGSAFDKRDDHVILPETISEEPLGPVVPHGDDQWFDVVKTVMAVLIYGEAYGVTSGNVASSATGDTKVDRLLGIEGSYGQESLGISQTAAQDILKAVGNYGEIYDRNLGPGGINLPRENGRNALWADATCTDCRKGGQIYAAPLR